MQHYKFLTLRGRLPQLFALSSVAASFLSASLSFAAPIWTLVGSDSWNTTSNWNTANVPINGDVPEITSGGTAIIDTAGSYGTFNELHTGNGNGSGNVIQQAGTTVNVNPWFGLARMYGYGGPQISASNNVSTYTMNGGAIVNTVNAEIGGGWTNGNGLSNSTGILTLNGASAFNASGFITLGQWDAGGTGVLNAHDTSTVTVTGGGGNHFFVGTNGSTGTVNADGSAVISVVRDLFIGAGNNSTGNVNLSGNASMSTSTGWIFLGRDSAAGTPSKGVVTMSGNSQLSGNGRLYIGLSTSTGNSLTQSDNSKISLPNDNFFVANDGGSRGTYNMLGGTLTTGDLRNDSGTATINQSGGIIDLRYWLHLGINGGSNGTYTLSGGTINMGMNPDGSTNGGMQIHVGENGTGNLNVSNGLMTSTGLFDIGDGGTGHVVQSGGAINSGGETWIGQNGTGVGTYAMSAGTLNSASWFVVGRQGANGLLSMSGGLINNNGGNFVIGDNGTSSMTMSGGAVNANSELWVGQNGSGNGTLNISGGQFTVNSWLAVGRSSATGLVNMTGGTVVKQGGGNIIVGSIGGIGVWNQSAGVVFNNSDLVLGENSNSGTYNLNGGTVQANTVRTYGSATGNLNFNGGTLQAITNNSDFILVPNPIVKSGGATIDTNGNAITITHVLQHDGGGPATDGGLKKTGAGTLTLTNNNTYTGPTTANNGTLSFATDPLSGSGPLGAVPSSATPNNIVFTGGILAPSNTLTINANRGIGLGPANGVVGGGGTLLVPNIGQVVTYNGIIASAGNSGLNTFAKDGPGSLILGGNSSHAGVTNIVAGSLYLNGSLASTGTINVAGGSILGGSGSGSNAIVADSGTVEAGFTASGALTLSSLAFSGNGIVNLANVGTGAAASIVKVNGNVNGGPNTVTLNILGATPTNLGSYKLIGFTGSLSNSAAFTLGTLPTLGARESSGGLSFLPHEIDWIVNGNYPIWTGAQTSEWSTATIPGSKNWKLAIGGATTDYLDGDTVHFDSTATNKVVDISAANVSPLSVSFDSGNYTVKSTPGTFGIVGNASLTVSSGSLAISTVNTYSGPTTVNGGTLQVGNANAIPSGSGKSNLVLNGGTAAGTVDLNGNATVNINGLVGTSGAVLAKVFNGVAGTSTLSLGQGDGSGAFAGLIKDNNGTGGVVAVIKNGAGTQVFSGANSYSGGTTVAGGLLQVSNATGIGSGSLTINAGELDLNSNGYSVASFQGSGGTLSDEVSLAGTTLLTTVQTTATTYAGSINNGGSGRAMGLTLNGVGGALTLSGSSNFSGGATVTAGTLTATTDNALGTSALTMNPAAGTAATLFTSSSPSIGGLSSSGAGASKVVLGGVASATSLSVGSNGQSTTFSGVISDTTGVNPANVGSVTKTGSGTLTLLGANSYTGTTTVSAGVISANTLANGGQPSSIGASTNNASNLILAGGLQYTGANVTTDRGYTVANNSSIDTANNITFGGTIASTTGTFTKLGAGTVTYTNTGTNVYNTYNGGPSFMVANGKVVFDGGATQVNTVHGEIVAGAATGSTGSVEAKSGTTNIDSWLSVGRGNGTTGLSSSFTVSGNAVVNAGQSSIGYWNGLNGYSANPVVNVIGNSKLNLTNQMYVGESGGANGTINVATNAGNTAALQMGAQLQIGLGGTGVVNVGNSGKLQVGQWLGIGAGNTGTLNVSGSATVTVGSDFNVGDTGNGTDTFNISGAATVSAPNIYVGKFDSVVGIANQNGGSVTATNSMQIGANATGTYNLNAGTLTTPNITRNAGSGTLNFNGGTLVPSTNNATWVTGLAANVKAGGAIVDTQGNSAGLQGLAHDPALGATLDGGLTKKGAGTLTLNDGSSYTGPTTVLAGTLQLGTAIAPQLSHRWSFNGNLNDSVGGANATLAGSNTNTVTIGGSQTTLPGGDHNNTPYISLGQNLLPTSGGATIELWATENQLQSWSRIFDFGAGNNSNYLMMSWTQGTNQNSDQVEWHDNSNQTIGVGNSVQPYALGTEYHIAMTLSSTNGGTQVNWYVAPSANGAISARSGSLFTTNSMASLSQNAMWLGQSMWPDNTASASYDEVRFWNSALSVGALNVLQKAGPDGAIPQILPVTPINLAAGATVDLNGNNQTVTSLNDVLASGGTVTTSVAGPITLTLNQAGTSTYHGAISDGAGTVGLILSGTGNQILAGVDTFTGGTEIAAGTLTLVHNGAIADGTSMRVDAGGSLIFDSGAAAAPIAQSAPSAGSVAAVPEPGTLTLLAAGVVVGFGVWRRKRLSSKS